MEGFAFGADEDVNHVGCQEPVQVRCVVYVSSQACERATHKPRGVKSGVAGSYVVDVIGFAALAATVIAVEGEAMA